MNTSINMNTGEKTLLSEIKQVFVEITRYPEEILEIDAHLEDDLGIDSVKLGEIYAVLKERYQLPEDLKIPPEQLTSIQGIHDALMQQVFVGKESIERTSATPKATVLSTNHVNDTPQNSQGTLISSFSKDSTANSSTKQSTISEEQVLITVKTIFAEVTRYPEEILDPEANLEDDLGIDSVKLGEIYAILKERFGLSEEQTVPPEQLQSIAGVASAISGLIQGAESEASTNGVTSVGMEQPVKITAKASNGIATTSQNGAISSSQQTYVPYGNYFRDKKVFISGSGRGLGKDIAVYLAELGATVVINSFHSRIKGDETCKEINDRGHKAYHIWGSMANPEHVERIWDEIEEKLGSIHYFIHAASNGMLDKLKNITADHWKKAFQTNIIGFHQSALRAVELMKKNGGGHIITISSPAAHGYVDYFAVQGAAKAALESLTRSMAVEFHPDNVLVNCVSPGPIYGDLLKKWPNSEQLIAKWEEKTFYDRLCEPRDVSKFIAFLLSDEAKLFNSSILIQDGGISSAGRL